jgi:hypothetical protein
MLVPYDLSNAKVMAVRWLFVGCSVVCAFWHYDTRRILALRMTRTTNATRTLFFLHRRPYCFGGTVSRILEKSPVLILRKGTQTIDYRPWIIKID